MATWLWDLIIQNKRRLQPALVFPKILFTQNLNQVTWQVNSEIIIVDFIIKTTLEPTCKTLDRFENDVGLWKAEYIDKTVRTEHSGFYKSI